MYHHLPQKLKSFASRAGTQGRAPDAHARQIILFGVLLTTLVLAYFYAADHYYFSTRFTSPIFRYLLMVDDFNTVWLTFAVCIVATWWRNPAPWVAVVEFLSRHVLALTLAAVGVLAVASVFV